MLVLNRALGTGASGEDVRQAQNRLADLGFLPGEADGLYGEATTYAVMAFQEANGLEVDGILGPKTLAAMNSNPVKMTGKIELTRNLEPGMKGLDVFKVQLKLYELDYFKDLPNGSFEKSTEDAVLAFQKDHDVMIPTGVMDGETLELLNEAEPEQA